MDRQKELDKLRVESSTCVKCDLSLTRHNVVFGAGDICAPLMIIGEAPGQDEDLSGEPFIGRSGKLLRQLIEEEIHLTANQLFITSVNKCRPPKNRDPKPFEIEACSPWLLRQIELVRPAVIVSVGNFSSRLLLKTKERITNLRGNSYTYETPSGFSTRLMPTFHPAAALQGGGPKVIAAMREDFARVHAVLDKAGVAFMDTGTS